jgi:hypothetical protein
MQTEFEFENQKSRLMLALKPPSKCKSEVHVLRVFRAIELYAMYEKVTWRFSNNESTDLSKSASCCYLFR